jgi:hypothetical protein
LLRVPYWVVTAYISGVSRRRYESESESETQSHSIQIFREIGSGGISPAYYVMILMCRNLRLELSQKQFQIRQCLLRGLPWYFRLLRCSILQAFAYSRNFSRGPASVKSCRDGISAVHCSIITISSLSALTQKGFMSPPSSARSHEHQLANTSPGEGFSNAKRSLHPMLVAKSTFVNSITALETGYLIQDTLLLLHECWKGQHANLRVLILHHVTLATALS